MRIRSSYFLVSFYMLFACEQANEQVNWAWYRHGEYQNSIYMELKKNGSEFNYGETDSTGIFQTTIDVQFDRSKSTLKSLGHDCELLDSLNISMNSQSTKFYKFFYDVPDSNDEEIYVYFNSDVGLLAFVEHAWDGYMLFETNDNMELLDYLKNDTTGFYIKHKR